MPQIEPRMISNQLQSSVFLYTCQSADVMEIIKKSPSKNGRCPYDHQFIRASFFQCMALKSVHWIWLTRQTIFDKIQNSGLLSPLYPEFEFLTDVCPKQKHV